MGYSRRPIEARLNDIKNPEDSPKEVKDISERNRELLVQFIERLSVDDSLSEKRVQKYISNWRTVFDKFVDVDLDEADKDDIRKVVGRIKRSDYSDYTKQDFKGCIRKYYNTMHEDEFDRSKRVRKILNANYLKRGSQPEAKYEIEALEPSEVRAMMDEADHLRNELLVALFFETGARIGEILGIPSNDLPPVQLKDIEMHPKYVDITLPCVKNDKEPRTLSLTRCVGLLQQWLERHPDRDNPQAPLFVNIGSSHKGQKMHKRNAAKIFRDLKEKAGITKRVTPHVFRHSAATFYGTEKGWSLNRMMYWFAWKKPEMARHYCKEVQKRIKKQKLEEEGIEVENDDSSVLDNRTCGRCGETWPPTQKYCGSCSLALDQDAVEDAKEAKEAGDELVKARMNGVSDEEIKREKQDLLEEMDELRQKVQKLETT